MSLWHKRTIAASELTSHLLTDVRQNPICCPTYKGRVDIVVDAAHVLSKSHQIGVKPYVGDNTFECGLSAMSTPHRLLLVSGFSAIGAIGMRSSSISITSFDILVVYAVPYN